MKNLLIIPALLVFSSQAFAIRTDCGENLYELLHQRGPFVDGKFQSPFKSPPPYQLRVLSLTKEQEVDLKALAAHYNRPLESVYRDYDLGLKLKEPLYDALKHQAVLDLLESAYRLKVTLEQYLTSGGSKL